MLQAWYPGEEGGAAVAETLAGRYGLSVGGGQPGTGACVEAAERAQAT